MTLSLYIGQPKKKKKQVAIKQVFSQALISIKYTKENCISWCNISQKCHIHLVISRL